MGSVMAQLGLTVVNKVILEFAMDIQYIEEPEGDFAALRIKRDILIRH